MMKVYIARYTHRHGDDLQAFRTEDAAEAWRQDIAREWWGELDSDPEYSSFVTPAKAADFYFEQMGEREREWFSVEETELQG